MDAVTRSPVVGSARAVRRKQARKFHRGVVDRISTAYARRGLLRFRLARFAFSRRFPPLDFTIASGRVPAVPPRV